MISLMSDGFNRLVYGRKPRLSKMLSIQIIRGDYDLKVAVTSDRSYPRITHRELAHDDLFRYVHVPKVVVVPEVVVPEVVVPEVVVPEVVVPSSPIDIPVRHIRSCLGPSR